MKDVFNGRILCKLAELDKNGSINTEDGMLESEKL